jgi:hypothetical protein
MKLFLVAAALAAAVPGAAVRGSAAIVLILLARLLFGLLLSLHSSLNLYLDREQGRRLDLNLRLS